MNHLNHRPTVGDLGRDRSWTLPHVHRRALLRDDARLPDSITLDELTAELVARDWDALDPEGDGGGVTERDIRVRLHHVDLPRLDDLGLLTYDHEEKLIRDLGGAGDRGRAE